MTSRLEIPDPEVQKAQIGAKEKLDLKQAEIGFIGKIFGSQESAPLNTAALICLIFSFCFIYVLIFLPGSVQEKSESLAIIAGIVLPIMGFIFGRSQR